MEMNRFLIERDVNDIAVSLCDQHIVKMPLEETQMLCTAIWYRAPKYAYLNNFYKPVHQKHPCTLWAMENKSNYYFALHLLDAMLTEYTYRYDKVHGSSIHRDSLFYAARFIPEGKNTKHPQCFGDHDDCRTDEFYPMEAYRNFYVKTKMSMARYNKKRNKPEWIYFQ